MKKTKQIGSIEIIDASSKESIRLFRKTHKYRKTLFFGYEEKTIFIDYEKNADKSMIKLLKEEALFYALFLDLSNIKNGYYYDLKKKTILIFEKIDNKYIVYFHEDVEEGLEEAEIIDFQFVGDSAFKIEEDYQEIKASNVTKNKKEIILLSIAVFLAIVFLFLTYASDFTEKQQQIIRPPKYYPLKKDNIRTLKRQMSILIINKLYETIEKTFSDKLTNDRIRRISIYSQNGYTILQSERARKKSNGQYMYLNKDLIKGGIETSAKFLYQQKYAGVGFEYNKKDIYVKEDTETYKLYAKDIKELDPPLTKKCIEDVIDFINYKNYDEDIDDSRIKNRVYVNRREFEEITFKIDRIAPSVFLEKTEEILNSCPAYLKNVSAAKGFFSADIILYNVKK